MVASSIQPSLGVVLGLGQLPVYVLLWAFMGQSFTLSVFSNRRYIKSTYFTEVYGSNRIEISVVKLYCVWVANICPESAHVSTE